MLMGIDVIMKMKTLSLFVLLVIRKFIIENLIGETRGERLSF